MAKPALYAQMVLQFFDDDGAPINGGKLYFYEAGTTTAKDTYTDSTLGTANPNPIILDSAGRPDNSGSPIDIWLDGTYKLVVKSSDDTTTYRTVDNLTALAEATGYVAKTADYTITAADYGKLVNVDATSAPVTITLLAAATAGAGFFIRVAKSDNSANAVTIDGDGSETINGTTTYALNDQYSMVELMSDGSNWVVASEKVLDPRFTEINDTNGNEEIVFNATASAVNQIDITNAATGNAPEIAASGDDTNVDLEIEAKGTGTIKFGTDSTGGVEVVQGDITVSSGDLTVTNEDSRTNSVDRPATITSTTDNTPAAGIGTGILLRAESANEAPSDFGALDFVSTDVTAASEDTDFVVQTRVAGAALADAYKFRVTDTGNYIFTGAPSTERLMTLPNRAGTFTVEGPTARAYHDGTQTISGSTTAKIQLDTESWDSDNYFDSSTNYRFTPLVEGYYQVNCGFAFDSSGADRPGELFLYKNGSIFVSHRQPQDPLDGASINGTVLSALVYLNGSTDYIEMYVRNNNGSGSLTVSDESARTFMDIHFVRGA